MEIYNSYKLRVFILDVLNSVNTQFLPEKASNSCITNYIDNTRAMNPSTASEYDKRLKNFGDFVKRTYECEVDALLEKVRANIENPYDVLINYRKYLQHNNNISSLTLKQRVVTAKNFLEYYDIEYSPRKFKLKVKLPRSIRRNKEALSKDEIIHILNSSPDIRLKTYVMLLAGTGLRAAEALATRICDYNFDSTPATVFIRGEYTKTKVDRIVYLTYEMTSQLKSWLQYNFRSRRICRFNDKTGKTITGYKTPIRDEKDLMFSVNRNNQLAHSPRIIYNTLLQVFGKTLDRMGKGEREDGVNNKYGRRRKITFHSLRRYTKSTISDLGYSDFSEFFIGHAGSTYYRKTEKEKLELYRKIEPHLIFLDYPTLERKGADVQSKIDVLEMENNMIRQRDATNTDAIANLSDQVMKLMTEVQELKMKK
jgi:integrase